MPKFAFYEANIPGHIPEETFDAAQDTFILNQLAVVEY